VVGLAGAYVAVAEDVDGNLQNPAAPAVRPYYSTDYFDFGLGFSLVTPADLDNLDYFNSGTTTQLRGSADGLVFATPALNLQWGSLGVGLTAEIQNYGLSRAAEMGEQTPRLSVGVSTLHAQVANAFMEGQLVVGLGIRVLAQVLQRQVDQENQDLFSSVGSGLEFGALYKPHDQPFRLGIAWRESLETTPRYSKALLPDDNGDITIIQDGETIYLPERVASPWDLNLGLAVQLGRAMNPVWRPSEDLAERAILQHRLRQLDRQEQAERRLAESTSDEEREAIEDEVEARQAREDELLERAIENARWLIRAKNAAMKKRYLLISGGLVISGKSEEAVGVDSFLTQQINRSGARVVYSPRLGLESEVWPNLLKLRSGAYLEPTRFETSSPRWHGTFGADIRLFRSSIFGLWPEDYLWRLSLATDASERYLVFGVSLGGWYPRWAPSPWGGE
jgi:hypothetical protein